MADRIPNAADPFEEEGLPGMNDGLPAKRITGDPQEGVPPRATPPRPRRTTGPRRRRSAPGSRWMCGCPARSRT